MGNLLKETPYSEITATLEVLDKYGWTRQHLYRLRTESKLVGQMTKLMAGTDEGKYPHYPVTVDYSRTLRQMIEAGRYDSVNDDITGRHFPVMGKGRKEIEIVLFKFDRDMESDEAIAKMDEEGCRPATLEELLALGEKYPDLQREFPIVAFGSAWRFGGGYRDVPYLGRGGSGRGLHLRWWDDRWDADCRFLAVRK